MSLAIFVKDGEEGSVNDKEECVSCDPRENYSNLSCSVASKIAWDNLIFCVNNSNLTATGNFQSIHISLSQLPYLFAP